MSLDEKAFTTELDICTTQAEEESRDEITEAVAQTEEDLRDAGFVDQADSGNADDMPSEDSAGEPINYPVEDDTDAGDSGPSVDEDGAKGDPSENDESEQEEPAAPAISDEAMTMAVRAGISIEDARQFPSDAALARVVSLIVDTELANRAAAEQQGAPEPAADPLAALPDLDPEDYDESVSKVIEMFNGLKEITQGQSNELASLRDQQAAGLQASREATARDAMSWFDESISGLDMADTLGAGGSADQPQGSSQFAKRDAVAGKFAVLMSGYEASGQPAPSRDEVFRESARLVLADEYQAAHDKDVSSGLEKRAGQHISRANSKTNKSTQSPEVEIAAMLDERFGGGR